MEFETNTPATAQDIAQAAIPKITVQPLHSDDDIRPTSSLQHTSTPTSFDFERETTVEGTANAQHPHKNVAFASAVLCGAVFTILVIATFSLR